MSSSDSTSNDAVLDQLAVKVVCNITRLRFDSNQSALAFIGAMGGAPKTNEMRDIMQNLGAALGNYEDLQNTTCIIESIKKTFMDYMDTSCAIRLACIIIGYNAQRVAPDETEQQIMLRVGALITAGDRVVSASASTLPKKPSDAIIALIRKAIDGHYYGRLVELAKHMGINMDGIPPYDPATTNCDATHMIATRLAIAVAQWESK